MSGRSLAVGGIGGVLLCAMLAWPTWDAVRELQDARAERARLAMARPADAVLADAQVMAVASAAVAAARLRDDLVARAAKGGVLVEAAVPAAPPAPGLAAIDLRVSGPEKAVLALADATERSEPLRRFERWSLVGEGTGRVRLAGRLVAAWRR